MWTWLAIILSLYAIYYAKKQVDLANAAHTYNQEVLEEIKKQAPGTQQNLKEEMSAILSDFESKIQSQNKMMEAAVPSLLQMMVEEPDKFTQFMNAAEKLKKK